MNEKQAKRLRRAHREMVEVLVGRDGLGEHQAREQAGDAAYVVRVAWPRTTHRQRGAIGTVLRRHCGYASTVGLAFAASLLRGLA